METWKTTPKLSFVVPNDKTFAIITNEETNKIEYHQNGKLLVTADKMEFDGKVVKVYFKD